jgi:FkbH-like protein
MGTYIARHIFAYNHQHYKVIVLDCDNTLWKGICGEDGAEGVKIEGPWLELQEFMLQKYRQGLLLVLCSKNNEADVWEVFAKNPFMPLKKDHFAAWRINWNPRSRNLEELAEELNLGIDSFILVDDNPLECSEVMTFQPEVLTVQLPGDPEEIPMFLNHIWAFDRVKVTQEDEKRSRMYVTERKRQEIRESMPSLEEFIKGLELKIHMMPLKPEQLPRASQLTQRTNQFNLSTVRRSEEDIRQLKQIPGTYCWILDVSDRFGEYGLTGLVIAKEKEEEDCLFIDTLLLSCRVLGRNVENALLTGLARFCRKRNLSQLKAHYYPTAKNKPLLEFLQRGDWKKTARSSDPDYTEFTLPVKDIPLSMDTIDFQCNGRN